MSARQFVIIIMLILLLTLIPHFVFAEAVAELRQGAVRIVLYDEPCALKELVINLPLRASWTEAGKEYRGCWGGGNGIVTTFFDDRTVLGISAKRFVSVLEL